MSKPPNTQVTISLTREQAQLLDQERLRLREDYDIRLSRTEIVQLLIETHRLRLQMVASEDSDAKWWKYNMLVQRDDDEIE